MSDTSWVVFSPLFTYSYVRHLRCLKHKSIQGMSSEEYVKYNSMARLQHIWFPQPAQTQFVVRAKQNKCMKHRHKQSLNPELRSSHDARQPWWSYFFYTSQTIWNTSGYLTQKKKKNSGIASWSFNLETRVNKTSYHFQKGTFKSCFEFSFVSHKHPQHIDFNHLPLTLSHFQSNALFLSEVLTAVWLWRGPLWPIT